MDDCDPIAWPPDAEFEVLPNHEAVIEAARKLAWIIRNEWDKEGEVNVHTDALERALNAYDGEKEGKK